MPGRRYSGAEAAASLPASTTGVVVKAQADQLHSTASQTNQLVCFYFVSVLLNNIKNWKIFCNPTRANPFSVNGEKTGAEKQFPVGYSLSLKINRVREKDATVF